MNVWAWLAALLLCGFAAAAARSAEFDHSYALIVGNDNYAGMGLGKLTNAESDASGVANYFRAQGYQVTSLIGPTAATKGRVDAAVTALAGRVTQNDRFVFFFSGHGKSRRTEGVDIAYLVVPGGRSANDPTSLISTGDIADYSRRLDRARHQLFIFDSCYAGLMGQFQSRGSEEPLRYNSETFLVNDLSTRRVRQYLSAGGEDQEVLDNGPARLSWFTYFLLKGLEPGTASPRASGLITFSELATYVQALTANPKHTPAFGSLAGHQGGEYLLRSTAQGSPQLPHLPQISAQTLRDLGFLTRSAEPAVVGTNIERMRKPVDQVYQAWQQKDLPLYMQQFDQRVVQTGQFKSGATFTRGYAEIAEHRRRDFARLDHVDVTKYEVMYQGSEGDEATFGVRYSMEFHWRDGTTKLEHNISECYRVREVANEQRWVIVRNDDYQHRICYR